LDLRLGAHWLTESEFVKNSQTISWGVLIFIVPSYFTGLLLNPGGQVMQGRMPDDEPMLGRSILQDLF
jgi:hypothetical protein